MAHIPYVDDLMKEYLLFRGFSSALRSLDNEIRADKDRGFRADHITDQILSYIQTYDLHGLRDLWIHLDRRLFCRLPSALQPFLPYLRGVEENPLFSMYFTKQWQDTLLVSLHNFLAVVFQNLDFPTLASYKEEAARLTALQEENELLRARLSALTATEPSNIEGITVPDPPSPAHLMDDFHNIAHRELPPGDTQLKSLKTLLFGMSEIASSVSSRKSVVVCSSPYSTGTTTSASTVMAANRPLQKPRRAVSQVSHEERRRSRSSSVNASSQTSSEHLPIKCLSGHVSSANRPSRSPIKSFGHQEKQSSVYVDSLDKDSFLILGQEYYTEHKSVVTHAVFNPSGSLVASADMDGIVKIWSPYPSSSTVCGFTMKSSVTAVEWFPKNDHFISIATKMGNMKLYDVKEKKTILDIGSHNCSILKDQRIMALNVSSNENSIVMSLALRVRGQGNSFGSSLQLFDIKSQKICQSIKVEKGIFNSCLFNHNQNLVICGCNNGSVSIVDLRTSDFIASWDAHQGEVFTLKMSPEENYVYTIGTDNKFSSWSLTVTGSNILDLPLHKGAAGPFVVGSSSRSVLLRPYGNLFSLYQDDRYIFTCAPNGISIYEMMKSSANQIMNISGHSHPVITVDWCSALECGCCIAASLDGHISITTLLPK